MHQQHRSGGSVLVVAQSIGAWLALAALAHLQESRTESSSGLGGGLGLGPGLGLGLGLGLEPGSQVTHPGEVLRGLHLLAPFLDPRSASRGSLLRSRLRRAGQGGAYVARRRGS